MQFTPFFLPRTHLHTFLPECRHALARAKLSVETATITYEHAIAFMSEFENSQNNYDSFKSELNVFLNWCWFVAKKDVHQLKRTEINLYIKFTNSPPAGLQSQWSRPMLVETDDGLAVNPDWRPFKNPGLNQGKPYVRKEATLKRTLSVLSSFYIFLADVEWTESNPAAVALRRLNVNAFDNLALSDDLKDKALSQVQLDAILHHLNNKLTTDTEQANKYERLRFLFLFLVLAFPRRSEISPRLNWTPTMADFRRHRVGDKTVWTYFIPSSKNGKSREVICSHGLMSALVRYRRFIGLPDYPSQSEREVPLFTRHKEASHGRQAGILNANLSAGQLADIIQELFANVADDLVEAGELDEANDLRGRSIHCCRHTGISNDLASGRRAKDVMKCSGHSSYQALSVYLSSRVHLRLEGLAEKDRFIG